MSSIGRSQLETALAALGEILKVRGHRFNIVVVGGGNLILSGLISRTTKDIDVLGAWTPDGVEPMRPMPAPLSEAIQDVARAYGFASDWLNLGPDSILDLGVPDGFTDRLTSVDYGGLVIWLAGRFDMVCFKLYAAVDQGSMSRHAQDLRALEPDRTELMRAARWSRTHDSSEGYRQGLVKALVWLGIEDADASLD